MEPDDVDKAKRWLKRMAEARLWNDDVMYNSDIACATCAVNDSRHP